MNCLFCQIIAHEIPADWVMKGRSAVAFNDIAPQAPTHVLILPVTHCENVAELAQLEPNTVSEMYLMAEEIAQARNLTGYRTVFNTGASAGQSVFHAHLHLIGGRELQWPPG